MGGYRRNFWGSKPYKEYLWMVQMLSKLTHLKHFALNTAKNFIKIFPNSYHYSQFKLGGAAGSKSFLEGHCLTLPLPKIHL